MREIEIERLVQWAYREELPKRGVGDVVNSWDAVAGVGELLTVIDDEPGFPIILGPPHPDALTIERAVQGLTDEVTLAWREHRAVLMGDLPYLAAQVEDPLAIAPADERGKSVTVLGGNMARVDRTVTKARQRVFSEVALIEQCARMGQRPRWNVGLPGPQRIIGRNNKPTVVGSCEASGRYSLGSHCPLQYTAPTIEQMIVRRAEYCVWHSALVRLTGVLLGWTLNDHLPLRPDALSTPWFDRSPVQPAPIAIDTPVWRTWPDAAKPERTKRAAPVVVPTGT